MHHERSRIATFPRYRTYAWASPAVPARSPGESDAALLDYRIHQTVDRVLATKGYGRTGVPASLLVDYDVVTKDGSGAFRDYFAHRQLAGSRTMGEAFARGSAPGTLVVHMVDPRTGELAYRASASNVIADQSDKQRLDDAIQRMLESFPPATASR